MRATLSGYYRNLQFDQSKVAKELFDVTKQISSGQKIQYAYEDTSTFIDTVRLDNEVTTLSQAKQNATRANQVSNNTDITMNGMVEVFESMKVKLIQAANGTNSPESLNAIALDLRGLEENMVQLANTSIDGKYLFSGSEIKTKPIDANGLYQGNDTDLKAFVGSGVEQKYNISGADLFLGDENDTQRKITTNIAIRNTLTNAAIKASDSIEDMMGAGTSPYSFYVRGTDSAGVSFKEKIAIDGTTPVSSLLSKIENLFGTGSVNVSLNGSGNIVIEDKLKGSSKIDFHIVGSSGDTAITNIDALTTGDVKEFIKSGLTSSDGTNDEAKIYDRTRFSKSGSVLTSNVSHVLNSDNSFVSNGTKLVDASAQNSLNGVIFNYSGVDVSGADFTATINLKDGGSSFTVDGNTYSIFNAGSPAVPTPADEMTYKQLTDVINMVVTGNLPTADTEGAYTNALKASVLDGTTSLNYKGQIVFKDLLNTLTPAEISLYDNNTNDFTAAASALTFNTNNALTIRDPKTDFFQQINAAITAVELGRLQADGTALDPRNGGIQNALQAIDDLASHTYNQHSVAGAQSKNLEMSSNRIDLLLVSTKSLRSEAIDADMAEAALKLQQLQMNYQAMLSTVSRISQLSLVNYL
ncbi:MAG: flagellar hook-associated protein FlgL [Campylobacterales bacterium]|nr:flagellar hook-associated protein FlgL [Campylobacterales bacterium]